MSEGAESWKVLPVYGEGRLSGRPGKDAVEGEPSSSLRFLTQVTVIDGTLAFQAVATGVGSMGCGTG